MALDFGRSATKRFCSRSMRDLRRVRSRVMIAKTGSEWKAASLAESDSSREEQKDKHREHRGTAGEIPRGKSKAPLCVPLCPLWLRIATVCSATDPDP